MVKHEKIMKESEQVDLGKHRAVAGGVRAPQMGQFTPQNCFYTSPGVGAKNLRKAFEDKIVNHFLGTVQKEYQITGTDKRPELPEALQQKYDELDEKSDGKTDEEKREIDDKKETIMEEWKPWYDLAFKCNLVDEDTKFPFEATVYIREDPSYEPPKDKPDDRRHVVYFTKHRGKAHKWPMMLFHMHAQVGGFFDSDQKDLPKVSPMKGAGGVGAIPAVPADLLDE